MNEQYRKEQEYMKEAQTDTQYIKNSTESWPNSLNKIEDRISDLEESIAGSKHQRENNEKPGNNNTKAERWCKEKYNTIGINKTGGQNVKGIKRLQ